MYALIRRNFETGEVRMWVLSVDALLRMLRLNKQQRVNFNVWLGKRSLDSSSAQRCQVFLRPLRVFDASDLFRDSDQHQFGF